jgi:uncharacterized membrane protein YcaP (DUF421 family)
MEIVIRATVIYWFLWLVMRASGKRELAQMSPFDLVLLVTMGDLVQQAVTQEDFSLVGAFISVGTLALWVTTFSYVSYKSRLARIALGGEPVTMVEDGHAKDDALRVERVTHEDLAEAARNHGIGDLASIRLAVLEPDGKFSFVPVSLPTDEPPEGASDGSVA